MAAGTQRKTTSLDGNNLGRRPSVGEKHFGTSIWACKGTLEKRTTHLQKTRIHRYTLLCNKYRGARASTWWFVLHPFKRQLDGPCFPICAHQKRECPLPVVITETMHGERYERANIVNSLEQGFFHTPGGTLTHTHTHTHTHTLCLSLSLSLSVSLSLSLSRSHTHVHVYTHVEHGLPYSFCPATKGPQENRHGRLTRKNTTDVSHSDHCRHGGWRLRE